MANVALNKRVLEQEVMQAASATDGVTKNYTSKKGFAFFKFPGTLTVDLEKVYALRCIRFLLWDGLGMGGPLNSRKYMYRLAVSKDLNSWDEVYRSQDEGTIGWQIFTFNTLIKLRYIRIYGLHNTANKQFHVVEVEAHDDYPAIPQGNVKIGVNLNLDGENEQHVAPAKIDNKDLKRIIATLQDSPIDKQVVRDIEARFEDLVVLDQNLNAIRREIVNPVTNEIKKSNRLAVTALTLTIIGLILTICFLFLSA